MRLPLFCSVISMTVVFFASCLFGEDHPKSIRNLDLETIQKLGREVHFRDKWTANAFDLLFEQYEGDDVKGISGWVTDRGDGGLYVHIIRKVENEFRHGFQVFFSADTTEITDMNNTPLPADISVRFNARRRALAAIPKYYTNRYNAVVLDDPESDGLLVYALASTSEPNVMLMGGHYRFTVPKDPEKEMRIDALSRSLVALEKPADTEKEMVGSVISHIVSDTPVETHVFGSLLYRQPFYVVTVANKKIWKVEDGTIELTDMKVGSEEGEKTEE